MKKFSKTLVICFAVIAVLAILLTGCSNKIGAELIANGGFEKLTSDKKGFENWEYSYMDKDKEDTANSNKNGLQVYSFPVGSEDVKDHGSHYIIIESKNYGVAHLKTSVKLYAGQKYLFKFQYNVSSSLKTESGDNDAIGVYLGFLEDKKFSAIENNTSTTSGWITREIYFQPSVTAKYTMVVGIGREDLGGATGKVEFDNLSVKAIKDVPEGENVLKLTPGSAVSDNEAGGVAYTVILTIFAIVLVVGAYYLIRLLQKRNKHIDNAPLFDDDNDGGAPKEVNAVKVKKSFKEFFAPDNLKQTFTSPLAVFIYTLVGAFIIRFILVLTVFGMGDTMIEYGKIGLTIAEDGMSKLYNIHNTNLPTGWLYLLSIFGLIGKALDFTEKSVGMSMLIRIPNIIADIAVCYMIYKMIANNYNYKYSSVIAGTYALLPAMFTASVAWGANISISIAFLIAMLSCMLEKKHLFVPIWFTLGLLFNNFMLIALPVVIGYEIFYCVKDKKAIINIVIASVLSFVVFYCLAIPFGAAYFKADSEINGGLLVFTKMLESIKANNLVSNSSFDFFAIFGLGNNKSNTALIIVVAFIMILFIIYGCYLFSKTRNRLDFILLTAMSFILWSVFGVGSKVEYTLIGVVLLLIYAGLKLEKRIFRAFGILSVTNFLNTAVILTKSGAINFAMLDGTGLASLYKLDPFYIIGSLVTLFTVVYLLWVMYDIMANGVEKEIKQMPNNLLVEFKEDFNSTKNRIMRQLQRKK